MNKILVFLAINLIATTSFYGQVKLVVGIVVDQMCFDYLHRFENKFSENGFKKLMYAGANCQNTQYNYVPTFTGPGHASIYTGSTPNNHGIIANDWYIRGTKRETNCVDDSTVQTIGSNSHEGKKSPKNLIANTITDELKLHNPKSKVFSVSIKDRGAILPGGHLSNGSYWFDYSSGNMISSTFFMQKTPKWLEIWNEEKKVDAYLKQTWNTLFPIETYSESLEDNSKYEVLLSGKKTPTFPYDFKEMNKGKKDKELFTVSPFANTFLADFALKIIEMELLGVDEISDFLAISFSTPDIAGHAFGPYSVEIEDIYLRLDLEIAKILSLLETKIGKENFVLFLTADHAVVPVPQFLIDHNLPGGYFYVEPIKKQLDSLIFDKYKEKLILKITNNNIYLDREKIKTLNLDKNEIENLISAYLSELTEIKASYTSKELLNSGTQNEWLKMIQNGYRPKESGDVIFILEPGFLTKSNESNNSHKGTSHGSAYNYDTQVPLLWYGKGITPQNIYRKIDITDIAATLAPILNIQRPNSCVGNPILELLGK